MSTLDPAGNSNGEVPVHLWYLAKKYTQGQNEMHQEWINRLIDIAVIEDNTK